MQKQTKIMNLITPIPVIAVTVTTMVGILMHDMHIDKATSIAMLAPAAAAATGAAASAVAYDKVISQNYHTHVERASIPKINASAFRSTLPNIQPPRDDDRRYVQNKKLMYFGGGDAAPLWPSV